MSTIRDPAYITDAGRTMMTAGGDVTYTKAVLYGQDISHLTSDQVKALTTIGSPLKEVKVGISDKQNTDRGTTVILEATFQNDNLANDLPYTAVGFFAQKGNDEKLIAVAVANAGAYLTATSPDGVATDALDLKLAIAIGDATNVTATVDPAGSVTPATLNGAINKLVHDLTEQIDTKADSTDLDKTNAEVAKKADSESVKSQVDAVNNSITDLSNTVQSNKDATDKALATKADQTAVNDQISKQVAQINTALDTKVTADYSYSKAELDKKLLDLTTDTNGKVDAGQVSTMIEGKADKADVDKQIKAVNDVVATKADKATVDAEISKIDFTPYAKAADVDAKVKTVTDLANTKANTVDVDSKIKTVTNLANTKANSADVYTKTETDSRIDEAKNTVQSNLDSVKKELNTAINTKANSDDVYTKSIINSAFDSAFDIRDSKINRAQSTADDAQTTANNALPKAGGNMNLRSTINWTGGGINDKTGNLGGLYWSGGTDSAAIFADQDVNDNLDLVFKLGDDDSNHFSFRNAAGQEKAAILANGQINSPTIQDLYNKLAQYTVDYNNNYVHDTTIDFNSYLHETRTIKVANVKANNGPLANTATIWGWLTTYHWDDNSVTQEYRDAGGEVFWRATNASASRQWTWHKYAKQEDIDNQQRQINDLINNINYIKDNYVEGRRFPASQEAQAQAWENSNPNGIAMIEK